MKHCNYCASTITKLDDHGYCKKYGCFERSGKKEILDYWLTEARKIWTMPDTSGQVGRVVSNHYSIRHRFANDIMWKAKKDFDGTLPFEILNAIPEKYRDSWDKNIRW